MRRDHCSLLSLLLAVLWAAAAHGAPLSNIAAIDAGNDRTCAVTASGGVKCWGSNTYGGIGDGTTIAWPGPVDVAGLSSGASLVAAGRGHSCAVTAGGGVKCWGLNDFGELGDGTAVLNRLTPGDVAGLSSGVVAIASGGIHTCAIAIGGALKCWGFNGFGQLGDGTTTNRFTPVGVAGLSSGVVAVTTNETFGAHTCALTAAGGVKCWGANDIGQLGDGTQTSRLTPVDVLGLSSGVAGIAAGVRHTCAVTGAGAVKCWGYDPDFGVRTAPVSTPLTSGIAAIAAGYEFTCALTAGGGVKCWGSGGEGQLGDGAFTNRTVPVDVSGLASGVAAIAAGVQHACALMSTGQMRCWGFNASGQLGNNTYTRSGVPVVVGAFTAQTIAFAALPSRHLTQAPFTVTATASSGLAVTFRSLAPSVCTVSGSTVSLVAIGICILEATQAGDAQYLMAAPVEQRFLVYGSNPGAAPRLANLSTRGHVGGGNDVMIGGFIVGTYAIPFAGAFAKPGPPSQPVYKTVLIRARGPSLASFGVANPIADPVLQLFSGQGAQIAANDDWQSGGSAPLIQSLGLAPPDPRESALLYALSPGSAYTAIVSGAAGASGVGTVEIFEIDHADYPLINISTRGQVLTGEDVMIAGFVIEGDSPQTVVVNVAGPYLSRFGISNPLANPMLTLVRSSDNAIVATNDDWQSASNAQQIQASGFAPSYPAEPAIMMTLAPGAYTAIVSGVANSTGVALVGVFAAGP
jgi:alpha-tubulin suppressor-like RCC1 family protein